MRGMLFVWLAMSACARLWAGVCDFDAPGAWTIRNHRDRLAVEAATNGAERCISATGPAKPCDTALSLLSRRIAVPAGTREVVVSFEALGSKFVLDAFREKMPWCNAIVWYGADGRPLGEKGLDHLFVPGARAFRRVSDWQRVPEGAAACEVRLGFDHPNLLAGEKVRYRGFDIAFVPAGASREAEFAARWKDGSWARDILYPADDAPRVPKITLRDDGVTLVDGRPFFPIGVYSVCRREFNGHDFDRAFRDLKAAGFNFAHTYGDAYDPEFLAAAEKYDFKLWVASKLPDEKFCTIGRRHPSILAWYLGDDTSAWLSPQEVVDRHNAVKALDPDRITCQADPVHPERPISCYGAYVRATDVFMPEIYPVRGKAGDPTDRTCVAKTIWDMERVRADVRMFNDGRPRGCWPILQWFTGWNSWEHFPSRAQLWATTWAAIVHGAHGMTWYTYGGFGEGVQNRHGQGITSTPERWALISELAHELGRWAPVLLERTPAKQPTVRIVSGPTRDPLDKGPSVTCLLKRQGGQTHLFAVNACPEPVTAEFTLPDGTRTTENFAPFGVLTR